MNPVIQMWQFIAQYLAHNMSEVPKKDEGRLVELCEKGKSVLDSDKILSLVNGYLGTDFCSDHAVADGMNWDELGDYLSLCAFRDLSPLKNPLAMECFWTVAQHLGSEHDQFLLAKKVTERGDGSVVIVLHAASTTDLCERLGVVSLDELLSGIRHNA